MYCTLADIERKRIPTETLIQLTDDDNIGMVIEETVNGCIHDAAVIFDSYMRGRYPLPLSPVPDLAVSIVADLAVYGIYCLRPQFEVPKTVQDRRTTALTLLARIQDGKMPLYDPIVTPPENGSSTVQFSSATPLFTTDTLRHY